MILPTFIIQSKQNKSYDYSGLDSKEHCRDPVHFENYPYNITYHYNSRGYRDIEWPSSLSELHNSIWCIGDSFTVGLGAPFEHTWPYQLSAITGVRCINVSMDGASNDWIARKSLNVLDDIKPETMIIQWSYIHRREAARCGVTDEDRRIHATHSTLDEDYDNFLKNYNLVMSSSGSTKIINTFVPDWHPTSKIYDTSLQEYWDLFKGSGWGEPPRSKMELNLLPKSVMEELHDCGIYQTIESYCNSSTVKFYKFLDSEIERNNILTYSVLDVARDGHHYDVKTANSLANIIFNKLT